MGWNFRDYVLWVNIKLNIFAYYLLAFYFYKPNLIKIPSTYIILGNFGDKKSRRTCWNTTGSPKARPCVSVEQKVSSCFHFTACMPIVEYLVKIPTTTATQFTWAQSSSSRPQKQSEAPALSKFDGIRARVLFLVSSTVIQFPAIPFGLTSKQILARSSLMELIMRPNTPYYLLLFWFCTSPWKKLQCSVNQKL